MKVFISWSGDLSHKVAETFHEWLPRVIQKLKPFISSQDIDKGERWGRDVAQELDESFFGIICVTKENLQSPWLNFEAGALSKRFPDTYPEGARVVPFLINLKEESDIPRNHPLLQFQRTSFERQDVLQMIRALNKACGPECLEQSVLEDAFETYWPKLEKKLNAVLNEDEPLSEKQSRRPPEDILEELLELARRQNKLLSSSPMPSTIYDAGGLDRLRWDLLDVIYIVCDIVDNPQIDELKVKLSDMLDRVTNTQSLLRRSYGHRSVGTGSATKMND